MTINQTNLHIYTSGNYKWTKTADHILEMAGLGLCCDCRFFNHICKIRFCKVVWLIINRFRVFLIRTLYIYPSNLTYMFVYILLRIRLFGFLSFKYPLFIILLSLFFNMYHLVVFMKLQIKCLQINKWWAYIDFANQYLSIYSSICLLSIYLF